MATGMSEWKYDIQYGPEGEANYAWVYDGSGFMVGTMRVHHAHKIVKAMNEAEAFQAIDAAICNPKSSEKAL